MRDGGQLDVVALGQGDRDRGVGEEPEPALHDRLEYRLHVRGRAADDAQDVGSGGLPLERLLGLVEQARVLDRDHRLVGERLQQCLLLLCEWAAIAVSGDNGADHRVLAQHGGGDQRVVAELLRHLLAAAGSRRISNDRRELHRAAGADRFRRDRVAGNRLRKFLDQIFETRVSVERGELELVAAHELNHREARAEEPLQVLDDRVEYRLGVRDRAADGRKDFAASALEFERLLQLGGALLHLALEARVGLAQLRGHAVELPGERLELVAGAHLDLAFEVAGADALRAFLQRSDGPHHAAREVHGGQRREQQAGDDQRHGAHDGRVQRRVDLCHRLLDEHLPAQDARRPAARRLLARRLDRRVGGQHAGAVQVLRQHRERVVGAGRECGLHLLQS